MHARHGHKYSYITTHFFCSCQLKIDYLVSQFIFIYPYSEFHAYQVDMQSSEVK